MSLSDADRDLLRKLEERLLDAAVRRSPDLLDRLLAEDFLEFGASGKRYDKGQIMAELGSEAGELEYGITDFRARALGEGLALVTYRARGGRAGEAPENYHRSSIWRCEDGGWRVLFHQGTPVPEGAGDRRENPAAGD